jgi:hypothetical protein
VEYCKPSFGNFLATARTAYWFGIPRSVSFPGLMMDIQRYAVMNVAKDYNSATDISYNRQSGMRASAYEHLIPEKLFTDQTQPNAPQAISAVKALAIAASQGQKIFTITQANQDIILPQINVDPDVMNEMQNALAAGREITVHQSPITQSGWTGSGYIITDPATGAGAYKISGGANGSFLFWFGIILTIVGLIAIAVEATAFFMISIALISFTDSMIAFFESAQPCGNAKDNVNLWLTVSLAGSAAITGYFGEIGANILLAITSWMYIEGTNTALGCN